jgi:hypothetical protein
LADVKHPPAVSPVRVPLKVVVEVTVGIGEIGIPGDGPGNGVKPTFIKPAVSAGPLQSILY